ncbi:uncharacterized protein LOC143532304 [Bidens hawaiensis]|uniref:uncharacterized protein LOC143532304 n=1 Tax=Bidens hawaiensis TaxID=980011 RepID=UPI00404A35A7
MVEQFLLKYFPPDKTAKYRASITRFRTDDDESLHAAWERYKGLLRRCPHHGLNKWLQVQTLFYAQSSQNKQAIDQIAGGDLGTKSPNEAFEVLEKAAKKSFAYSPPRSTPSHKGMHHVDSNTLVTAQLEALSKKFEQLQTELVKAKTKCNTCGGEHKTKYCQQSMMVEDVDYVSGQNNTFGNTYNPCWSNHPNFSWKDGANNQAPPGFQKNEAELRNQKASLQNIENHVGQLAQLLSERQPGGLPSNTVTNPNAQANAITLRSGKITQDVVFPSQPVDDETEIPDKVQDRNALADLGASINLMPYAVFSKLGLGEPKTTRMSIQLANRSVKYPRGIVENMLVKIDKFVYPVDFVILDMDEDKSVPVILGRPFRATARALIDVCIGKLTLRVEDEEDSMEIFMDDFSVFGNSFDHCLENLRKMFIRCEEANLVLNWEKCHFMFKEGVVLGHKISKEGLEVDKAKIETISKLPPPTSVKSIRSFLGQAGFYSRFIKDFLKIARPMTRILEEDVPFVFSEECLKAFQFLKDKLVDAPIMVAPN